MNCNRKSAFFIFLSGFIPGLFFTACTSFFVDPPGDSKITTDDAVLVAEQEIPASGGTLSVQNGGILEGFTITVPPGSFDSQKTFKITTAEITSHDLGAYFNPISPLIQIEYEGGYAEEPLQVTIPVAISDGEFPIGFFYDDVTGSLEGLPLLSYTSSSVVLLTRHFMSGSDICKEWEDLKGESLITDVSVDMVVTTLTKSALGDEPVISSGFTPGTDDWEFPNFGSYISPGGHCAGQSMTAMWYYYEKKLQGEPPLYHQSDMLNDELKPSFMWMDNPLGYRFSSVIQKDFNFDGWINSLELQSFIPEITFNTFAATIRITGEPQSVLIRSSKGEGGHAMIVYKVDYNDGKLYIADPNFPNNIDPDTENKTVRTIIYENGMLKPYETGLNAGANSVKMDQIGYSGKTSYIPWGQIGKRYNEVLDSTIGTIAPNTFPTYTIWAIEKDLDTEITNANEIAFTINSDTLRCIVECPDSETTWFINGKERIPFNVYDENGEKTGVWDANSLTNVVTLKPGLNKIGFLILGAYKDKDKNVQLGYVDFKWLNVNATITDDEKPEISSCIVDWKIFCELDVISGTYRDTIQDYAYAGGIEIPLTKIGENSYESDFHYTFFDNYNTGTFRLTIYEKSHIDIELNVTDSYLDGVNSTYKKVYKFNATNIPYDSYLSTGENNPGGFRLWSEDFLDHISNFDYYEEETFKTGDKPIYTKELIKILKSTGYYNNFIEVKLH